MAAKEVKKATLNLSCPVCYQVFKNPKYLPCYHSYCEECLEKMVKGPKITCPECRKEAIVPTGGVKELASNFLINSLVDELILKRKVDGEEETRCDNCDEDDPVVTFCPDCGLFLCDVCNETHKRAKASRGHDIVPLTEMKSKQDMIQPKAKAPMCKKHDIELIFYCETCEELVCMYCTVKDHAGHEHDTVKLMATKHRNELKELTAPVEVMITDLSQAHDNIEKMRKTIIQRGEEVDNEIDQRYNELVQKLMKQKEQTKQQARDAVSQKDEAMMKQLKEVELAQAEVSSMKELKDAVEKSSDQEALSAKKQVIDHMQQLTIKYKKLNTQPVQSATMEFVSIKQPLPQFGQLFTNIDPAKSEIVDLPNNILVGKKVEFTIITKYHNGHQCSRGGSQVSVQLESNSGEVTAVQVRDNNNGRYVASFTTQSVGKVKISVFTNRQQFTGSPYSVNVTPPPVDYTKVTKPSKIVNNGGSMGKPWGIAFTKNGFWAVADNSYSCVYLFDGQDNLIKKIGSRGSGVGQFNYPCGVTFDCNDHLYVADYGNNRVQKFDVSGNYMFQYGSGKGSQDGQLNGPRGVTVHDGRLYVADRENCRISVFQVDGEFCCIIGKAKVNWPYDVAVNVNNQLLVVDRSVNCVHAFTLDGRYMSRFGSPGYGAGQLNSPCGLAVELNSFTFIAECDNHRVSVFNKDGKYIHHFGSCGDSNGQFRSVYGVAVSPDNKIYVSDCGGKRVQIFSVN